MKLRSFFGIIMALIGVMQAGAQESYFSQFYASPLHLNPALAGISEGPRFAVNYRNQWPSIGDGPNGSFVNYALSYDQHFEKMNGGIGVLLSSERVGGHLYVKNNVGFVYSYQARLRKNLGFKMGLNFNYTNEFIDWFELRFTDMINPVTGFRDINGGLNTTAEPQPFNTKKHIFSVHTGAVLFSSRFYGGFSVRNLINTTSEFVSIDKELNRRGFSVHGGTQFNLKSKRDLNVFVTPNFNYLYQFRAHMLSVGAVLNVQYFFTGLWLRHNLEYPDAVVMLIGVTKGIMRLGYSFDSNISPVHQNTGGSHELSLIINLRYGENSLNPSALKKTLRCPDLLSY